MKPKKLPDGWIIGTSNTIPNRIYYFNTKTNESSWEFPVEDVNSNGPLKYTTMGKKRKNEDFTSEDQETANLDMEPSKKNKVEERRVLKAKRYNKPIESKGEKSTGPNTPSLVSKDTPQMRLLREKMLQRQTKGNASKKSKVVSLDSAEKEAAVVSATNVETDSNRTPETQTMTPQMRILSEKIKSRQSKVGPSKTPTRRSIIPKVASPAVTSTLLKTKSMDSAATTVDEAAKPVSRRSSRSATSDTAVEKIAKSLHPVVSISRQEFNEKMAKIKSSSDKLNSRMPRKSLKKNLAAERLEKLQRSLNDEQSEADKSLTSNESAVPLNYGEILRQDDDAGSPKSAKDSPPNIYRNAETRAKLLRDRLQNKSTYEKKMNASYCEASTSQNIDNETERIITMSDSFQEEMDWEPIEDAKIIQEIQVVRSQISAIGDSKDDLEILRNGMDIPDGSSQRQERSKLALYIVIDTNVFLSNITAVEEARDAIFKNYGQPLIVIPWTVIRELDFIKDNKSNTRPESLRAKARQAVRFLHQHFSARHPRILGQTYFDVATNREKFAHDCPDDEILQLCLQIRSTQNNVVLLSYDKNLCNKAMIHDVVTLGRHDPFEKVDYLHASDVRNDSLLTLRLRGEDRDPDVEPIYIKELRKAEELMESAKEIVSSFMEVIVTKEMQSLYNDNWERYTFIRPPWSVQGVLKCAIKHWIAAVSNSFSVRTAESLLKELSKSMNDIPDFERKLSDVGHILEIINDLLQCVKVEKYPNVVAQSARAIADLRAKCVEACKHFQEEKLNDAWGSKSNAKEEEERAERGFQQFEEVYSFARDTCGLLSSAIGMPCSFQFKKFNPEPSIDDMKDIQPDVAANLNRLIQILGAALEEINGLSVEHRAVEALYNALVTFIPERKIHVSQDFNPSDVFWCLKKKEKVLKLGLAQLQELSNHFCHMASFRCT